MLSLLLLIGAGLFIRSLRNLRDMGPGFTTGNLVAFEMDPSLNGYKPDRAKLFFRQLTTERGAHSRSSLGWAGRRQNSRRQ